MSAKAEALYALAAYRRLMRGLPGAGEDDAALAVAEQTIRARPDPDVAQGAPPVIGGEAPEAKRVPSGARLVRAARAKTKTSSRRKAKR